MQQHRTIKPKTARQAVRQVAIWTPCHDQQKDPRYFAYKGVTADGVEVVVMYKTAAGKCTVRVGNVIASKCSVHQLFGAFAKDVFWRLSREEDRRSKIVTT